MKMPWGKYRGEELEDVPTEYLEWLLRESTNLSEEMAEEMENQILLRSGRGVIRMKR